MSQYYIYLTLPKYLAEWITARLGSPVVFPHSSPQNAVIRTYIQKLPSNAVPEINDGTKTAIAIPYSVAKPPEQYNYMGEYGKRAVAETIKDLFLRALWADISPIADSNVGLNKLIAAWCEANGIDVDRSESVRQCFYRIRKDMGQSGINLRKSSRKR